MSVLDFKSLKKNSNKSLGKLAEEAEKLQGGDRKSDDRFWTPTVDKAENGFAILRFLPAPKGEDLPWVRVYDHGFQGPGGKWYIENSLTTIGQDDPVSELNSSLWNSGLEKDKAIARKQKRRLKYYSNVLVVKDSAAPENEGKVFLFRYGPKIFEKLQAAMKPQFEDEEPFNPFDFWEGANFKLKIRKYEGYRNYDKSEFDSPSPLSEDDKELERIWNSQHSLQEFLDPKNFKSYEELKRRLNTVLAGSVAPAEDDEEVVEAPRSRTAAADNDVPFDTSESTDSMDYFKSLAEETDD